MLSTSHGVRPLASGDLAEFLALTDRDPVVNVFVAHRARTTNLEPRWLGGEVWGRFEDGRLRAGCHLGANLVLVEATPDDARAFADQVLTRSRTVSTIVGLEPAVTAFWESVAPEWGEPRDTRWHQPHLEIAGPPKVAPDPEVRRTTRADMDQLYPSCVAMYTEEVGMSPEEGGGAELYRARVLQLIDRGWSFARFDGEELIFKAEVACATPAAAQIQGVWVAPHRRGQGLAATGMAAVVDLVQRDIAPVVSLYVNEWNEPARRTYARVGFTETARFATVMF